MDGVDDVLEPTREGAGVAPDSDRHDQRSHRDPLQRLDALLVLQVPDDLLHSGVLLCSHRLCGEACDGTALNCTFGLLVLAAMCGLPPPPHVDVSLLGCTSYALTSANPLHSRASTTAAIRSRGTRNPTAPDSTISSSLSETSPRRPACSSTSKTSGAWLPLWSSFTTTSDSALLTLDLSPTSVTRRRRYSRLNCRSS